MLDKAKDIKAVNLNYYEEAYSGGSLLKILVKQLFSYDQLSKTRRNLAMARKMPQFAQSLSVLDYGFGHGTLLLRMPRRHRIFGCELSTEAVRNVKSLGVLLRREVNLFFPDELAAVSQKSAFDLVCCSHVIEHVDDEGALLKSFYDALGTGGFLLLNVPINEVWIDPKHVRTYLVESTCRLLENSGFEVQEALEADRWTAWILHCEQVSAFRCRFLFRAIRFVLAALPVSVLDALENVLPKKFQCQQLLVLAKKV